MKYFTINEFIQSELAEKNNIDNSPTIYQENNIKEFVENLLDPLREAWAMYCEELDLGTKGINITSGLRSEELNKLVNGSKTSAHYHGWAADLVPTNNELLQFKRFCINWLEDKKFDQIISEDEDSDGVPRWIHIGYKRGTGEQRRQFMYMKDKKYYYM